VLLNEQQIHRRCIYARSGKRLNRTPRHRAVSSASLLLRFRDATRCLQGKKDERGTELVEYAIVLTLLLMALFGLIDFGRALYAYHFVSEAAREGTRFAMVRGTACQSPGCPAGPTDIQNYVMNVPAGIDAAQLTVTPTWNPSGSATCTGPQNAPGCVVEVQVSYNFKFMLPFLPWSTVVMQSSSQMIISQ
jgi:Flp pilus assembly protein TadG